MQQAGNDTGQNTEQARDQQGAADNGNGKGGGQGKGKKRDAAYFIIWGISLFMAELFFAIFGLARVSGEAKDTQNYLYPALDTLAKVAQDKVVAGSNATFTASHRQSRCPGAPPGAEICVSLAVQSAADPKPVIQAIEAIYRSPCQHLTGEGEELAQVRAIFQCPGSDITANAKPGALEAWQRYLHAMHVDIQAGSGNAGALGSVASFPFAADENRPTPEPQKLSAWVVFNHICSYGTFAVLGFIAVELFLLRYRNKGWPAYLPVAATLRAIAYAPAVLPSFSPFVATFYVDAISHFSRARPWETDNLVAVGVCWVTCAAAIWYGASKRI